YRHSKTTRLGILAYKELTEAFRKNTPDQTEELLEENRFAQFEELVRFIHNAGNENLSGNQFQLLINGEKKFPELLRIMESAKEFIHLEYYAWENDTRGNQIKDVLLKKAAEGVKIRAIYDDYASRKIKRNIVKALKNGGVEIYPMIRVRLRRLAA